LLLGPPLATVFAAPPWVPSLCILARTMRVICPPE